jgi:hypothetical protein
MTDVENVPFKDTESAIWCIDRSRTGMERNHRNLRHFRPRVSLPHCWLSTSFGLCSWSCPKTQNPNKRNDQVDWRLTHAERDAIVELPIKGVGAKARALGVSIGTLDRIVTWGGGKQVTHELVRTRLRALTAKQSGER